MQHQTLWKRWLVVFVLTLGSLGLVGALLQSTHPLAAYPLLRAERAPSSPGNLEITATLKPEGVLLTGQQVTLTLLYANHALTTATDVVIEDWIPHLLRAPVFTSSGTLITPTGTPSYTWQVAPLGSGEGGYITVTAYVNARRPTTATNTVTIRGWLSGTQDTDSDALTVSGVPTRPYVLENYPPAAGLNITHTPVHADRGFDPSWGGGWLLHRRGAGQATDDARLRRRGAGKIAWPRIPRRRTVILPR